MADLREILSFMGPEELDHELKEQADYAAGLLPEGWCRQCFGVGQLGERARPGVWLWVKDRDGRKWPMCGVCRGSGSDPDGFEERMERDRRWRAERTPPDVTGRAARPGEASPPPSDEASR